MEKKMKKFLVPLIVLALCLFTIACGTTCKGDKCGDTDDTGDTVNDCDDDCGRPEGDTDTDCDDDDCGRPEGDTVTDCDDDCDETYSGEIQIIKIKDDEGSEVKISECVVTGIEYIQDSQTHENTGIKAFYVSEIIPEAKPYSGIYVFVKNAAVDFCKIGNKLEITGTYKKYYGGPQIETTEDNIKKLEESVALPEPIEVAAKDIATPFITDPEKVTDSCKAGWTSSKQHGEKAKEYEGVLVKVNDVAIVEENICHGAFTVTDDLAIYKNLYYYSGKRTAGKKFESIQGVLMYTYDAYELAPTTEEDLVEAPIIYEESKIREIKSEDKEGKEVKISECVVTGIEYIQDSQTHENTGIKAFYVSEIIPKAEPYSGIYVFVKNAAVDFCKIGDKLEITGTYKKYYGAPQIETQEGNITKLGENVALPEPAEVASKDIATPFITDPEKVTDSCKAGWTSSKQHGEKAKEYEGVLVKVNDVAIVEENICHGAFTVTDDLAIYKNLYYYSGKRTAGKKFESIQGVLMYTYDAYELAPTTEEDLVEDTGDTGDTTNDDNTDTGDTGNDNDTDTGDTNDDDTDTCEPATIKEIQSGTKAKEDLVKIENAIVITPVVSQTFDDDTTGYTFYVSDGTTGDYSGLYIYRVTSDKAPAKGDKVTIEGQIDFYGKQWEIKNAKNVGSITKTGTGTVPAAVKKAYADLAEKDKGTFIELTDTNLEVESVDGNKNVTFTNGVVIKPKTFSINLSLKAGDKVSKISGVYDVTYGVPGLVIVDANDVK